MSDQDPVAEAPLTFRGLVRTGRKAAGLSQDAAADLLGVTQPAVSAWESGAGYPTPANLVALADLLGLNEGVLLRLMVSESGTAETKETVPA